jgi:hypothetical protein
MSHETLESRRRRAESQNQEPPGKRKVFEEIPKRRPLAAGTAKPEILFLPELLPKQCGHNAVHRKHECGEPIGKSGQYGKRRDGLDGQAGKDHDRRQRPAWYRFSRLR